ncbi:MAG: hypothetical protein WD649_03580 [Thermoleophilaceae bacterium]
MTRQQIQTRDRFERLIGFAAPALNLVLAAGERLSRMVEPEDNDYYPPRSSQVEPPPQPTERLEAEKREG